MNVLKNCWYMAGWDVDCQSTAITARTIAGIPLAIWRDDNGQPAAIVDRCPHRFVPLSKGKCLPNGSVQCGYHGLEFDGSGRCTRNPHGDGKIPRAARVQSFPVIERYGIIWVWLGT